MNIHALMENKPLTILKELEYLANLPILPNVVQRKEISEKSLRLFYSISRDDIRLILLKKISLKIGWRPIISVDEGHGDLEIHFYKTLKRNDKMLISGGKKESLKGTNKLVAINYFCSQCLKEINNSIKIFNDKDSNLANQLLLNKNY